MGLEGGMWQCGYRYWTYGMYCTYLLYILVVLA